MNDADEDILAAGSNTGHELVREKRTGEIVRLILQLRPTVELFPGKFAWSDGLNMQNDLQR